MANPDISRFALAKPKPGSGRQARASLKRLQQAVDRKESEKVKVRSGGRCEVIREDYVEGAGYGLWRCYNTADHIHHLLGGRGVRGAGKSALAEHKLHVCFLHHHDLHVAIGGKKLIRVGGTVPHYTDRYRRA